MRILSDPANLASVRKSVEELTLAGGFDAGAVGEVALCVNEALANVMRHAYNGAPDRPIDVSAELTRDAIVVRIRDWGTGVNPEALPHPPHDPLKPGGLGLICLRQMMDDVHFESQPDGMLLEMSRKKKR